MTNILNWKNIGISLFIVGWMSFSVVSGNPQQEQEQDAPPCITGTVSARLHLLNHLNELINTCELSNKQITKLRIGIKGIAADEDTKKIGERIVVLKNPRKNPKWSKLTTKVLSKKQLESFTKRRQKLSSQLAVLQKTLKKNPNSQSAQIEFATLNFALYLGLTQTQTQKVKKMITEQLKADDTQWRKSVGEILVSKRAEFKKILDESQLAIVENEKRSISNFGVDSFAFDKWLKRPAQMQCNLCHAGPQERLRQDDF